MVYAQVLVHSASANEGRTRDGVAAGGRRLAAEVEQLVADGGGSLRTISLVGNSLGGLYARHAAAELWRAESGLIAGLEPDAFVSVGCPHLGMLNKAVAWSEEGRRKGLRDKATYGYHLCHLRLQAPRRAPVHLPAAAAAAPGTDPDPMLTLALALALALAVAQTLTLTLTLNPSLTDLCCAAPPRTASRHRRCVRARGPFLAR